MYVRRKSNRSGSTSVVVVEKRDGNIIYHTTIGISSDEGEIRELMRKGKEWINKHCRPVKIQSTNINLLTI